MAKQQRTLAFEAGILEVVADLREQDVHQITVRQLFYQCVSRGLVDKSEKGYDRVQERSGLMREEGLLPYDLFVDPGRAVHSRAVYTGVADALASMCAWYAESPWTADGTQAEVWLEKEALAGLVEPLCHDRYVTLRIMKGFTSHTCLWDAAARIAGIHQAGGRMIIYQLGDYDASGQCALDTTAKRTMAMVAERGGDCSRLTFVPLALSRDQVLTWNLPTRPPKKKEAGKQGSGHEAYGDEFAVELDAIPPVQFRELIIGALETHLSADDLAAHEDRVEGVRLYLRELAKVHAQDSPASLE